MQKKMDGKLIKFEISKTKNKKYAAIVDNKRVNFGDKRYE